MCHLPTGKVCVSLQAFSGVCATLPFSGEVRALQTVHLVLPVMFSNVVHSCFAAF